MLFLFDGNNVLHAGRFRDRDELVDSLAGYLALQGGRGIVVFDGAGPDATIGPLEVRFAEHADDLVEHLAAERRTSEPVTVVSSDRAVHTTVGPQTRRISAATFLRELKEEPRPATETPLNDRRRAGRGDAPAARGAPQAKTLNICK